VNSFTKIFINKYISDKNQQSFRETRDERQIEGPKKVLASYRKNQSYRETKMKLLHQLQWIDQLSQAYNDTDTNDQREWFRGYHIYNSEADVIARFKSGRPLSCFSKNGDCKVHIAMNQTGRNRGFSERTVSYITIKYNTVRSTTQNAGVHFCEFKLCEEEVKTEYMSKLQPGNDIRYALMLPLQSDIMDSQYKARNRRVRYTLVYWDWEVLTVKDMNKSKGRVGIESGLFEDVIEGL